MSDHWTVPFIGFEYSATGEAPSAMNCWAFFRHVQRERFGRTIPAVVLDARLAEAMRLFRDRPATLGWEKVDAPACALSGDAVLMGHRRHPHHIGVWVDDYQGGGVLHCVAGVGSALHSLFHLDLAGWQITGIYRPID